jgi:hypothetical protein
VLTLINTSLSRSEKQLQQILELNLIILDNFRKENEELKSGSDGPAE